jgi:hypothetical protein
MLPAVETRQQMETERPAALARPMGAVRLAPQAVYEPVTRREVTEVLDRLDRAVGSIGQAAVQEEGDRDVSAFIALGVVVGIVALALSS